MAWLAMDGVKVPLMRLLPRPEARHAFGLGGSIMCGYELNVWGVEGGIGNRLAHLALGRFPGLCMHSFPGLCIEKLGFSHVLQML